MTFSANPTSKKQFNSLRSRLLLSYLGVIVTILGISGVAVYKAVAHKLNQQLDDYLLALAETAAQTLEVVKHEYYEHKLGEYPEEYHSKELPATLSDLMAPYKRDGEITILLQNPSHYHQGVEWFDEKRQLLIKEGNLFPSRSLPENLAPSNSISGEGTIRTLILPVLYVSPQTGKQQLTGYIRVSKSTEALEAELVHLRWGLGLGGIIALVLTAIGGMWLTRQSLQPVEKSFQQLKQFTADASHELRSPLTAIKTSVGVMQMYLERIHPADAEKLEAIASASNQMTRLIEDLLLLARLDGAPATMTREWLLIPIDEILEDLLDCAEPKASEKQISLNRKLLTDVFVLGDAQQLKRLFANLLDNALQYTMAGGTVTVTIERREEDALISVEDTGIGIAPEDIPSVFDRFWRADRARSDREDGTGLGMAIAKTIACAHGGQIIVTSQVGIGSCFQVWLPLV